MTKFFVWLIAVVWLVALKCAQIQAATLYAGLENSPAWPSGIVPYVYNDVITADQRTIFEACLAEWALAGNVHFIPRTTESGYIIVDPNGDNLAGAIWRWTGTPQRFSPLGWHRAQILHEVGHLLGFTHEIARVDRDNFLDVLTERMVPGNSTDEGLKFIDPNATILGAYDFHSVMSPFDGFISFKGGAIILSGKVVPKPQYQVSLVAHQYESLLSVGDMVGVARSYGAGPVLGPVVTNTKDGGVGSLRAAIYFANAHPGTVISFNISRADPGFDSVSGVFTIKVIDHLPTLKANRTVIDGGTQPGFAGKPLIMIDGSWDRTAKLGWEVNGLKILASGCLVKSLMISGFSWSGVRIVGPTVTSNRVQGCYIGTDATGKAALGNTDGVIIEQGAKGNLIGGIGPGEGNFISGNTGNGIQIMDVGTSGNWVQGNFIGTTKDGNAGLTNGYSGVLLSQGASDNSIGGSTAGTRNVISGNGSYGVVISDVGTTNNLVQGNFIGVDTSGSRSLANAFAGVGIYSGAQSNLIGGATTQARNFISGNRSYGVQIAGLGSDGNRVQGNFIGTDINGTAAVLNSFAGVGIYGGAKRNTIGGSTPEARNLISGHDSYGIIIADSGTKNNWVAGNFIGTELTGSRSLKNGFAGIGIYAGAQGNLVGGTATSARNVISGNNSYGVIIQGQEASGNLFQGNFIGTQADGTTALGNGFNGIGLFGGPSQNIIGLAIDGTGAGNTVAFNASDGIRLDDTNSVGNTIRGNRIYSNGGLGIELGGPSYFGVTANDAGDADMGPNQLQNYPILTSAAARSATTTITGTFHSAPNRAYIVDIYRGTSPDPSGHGEGQSYVGTTSLSTDANGNGSFTMSDSGNFAGQYFSATATAATTGDTSEFSSALLATNAPFSSHFVGPYVRNSSGFTFELYLQTNRAYRLQGTANLGGDPIPWLDLTNFTAPSSPIQFIDRSASNYPARFYRVISP